MGKTDVGLSIYILTQILQRSVAGLCVISSVAGDQRFRDIQGSVSREPYLSVVVGLIM